MCRSWCITLSLISDADLQLLSNTLYYKRFFPCYCYNMVCGLDQEGVHHLLLPVTSNTDFQSLSNTLYYKRFPYYCYNMVCGLDQEGA